MGHRVTGTANFKPRSGFWRHAGPRRRARTGVADGRKRLGSLYLAFVGGSFTGSRTRKHVLPGSEKTLMSPRWLCATML